MTASEISSTESPIPEDKDREQSTNGVTENQYPHGLKLVALAGASVVSIFLIALDQVRPLVLPTIPLLTHYSDHRRHSRPQNHG